MIAPGQGDGLLRTTAPPATIRKRLREFYFPPQQIKLARRRLGTLDVTGGGVFD
jgi:hypothetical protein